VHVIEVVVDCVVGKDYVGADCAEIETLGVVEGGVVGEDVVVAVGTYIEAAVGGVVVGHIIGEIVVAAVVEVEAVLGVAVGGVAGEIVVVGRNGIETLVVAVCAVVGEGIAAAGEG
jgi:hypothetical protein